MRQVLSDYMEVKSGLDGPDDIKKYDRTFKVGTKRVQNGCNNNNEKTEWKMEKKEFGKKDKQRTTQSISLTCCRAVVWSDADAVIGCNHARGAGALWNTHLHTSGWGILVCTRQWTCTSTGGENLVVWTHLGRWFCDGRWLCG